MRIAIDHSPLVSTHKLSHKIRGTGFYTKNLIASLKKYHPENEYILFTQGEKLKNIDLYHFPYFDPFFLTLPYLKLGKTVITIHDLTPLVFPDLFPSGMKGNIKFMIQKFLAKKADAIITDSMCSKLDIEKILMINPDRVFPVLLAAGDNFKKKVVSMEKRKELMIKFNIPEKFALYVGDATPNKNLKNLIDACLLSHIPLVIAGGAVANKEIDKSHPWNKDIIYVQEASKTSGQIFLLGFVSDDELVDLYNIADIFVMPSLYEGFGLPVLEAATCGAPIVTSRGGSIPEVIGDAAVFFDPNSAVDMSKKMQFIFNNESEKKKYSKLALKQSEKFSWEKTARETVKVYEKIL